MEKEHTKIELSDKRKKSFEWGIIDTWELQLFDEFRELYAIFKDKGDSLRVKVKFKNISVHYLYDNKKESTKLTVPK